MIKNNACTDIVPLLREMKKIGIDKENRRKIFEHPESVANIVACILSLSESTKDIYMSALGLGNEEIESFHRRIGEKNFHQSYDLFKGLESFFDLHYEVDLGIYIINENGDGELLIGNQNTHKRDIHLDGDGSQGIEDYKTEHRSMKSRRFESDTLIEGDGGKGAIRIDLPWGKTAILSFGGMGSEYGKILKIRQGFEKGGFCQIIRAKLEHIHKVYKDPLTGLYNREYFNQIAEKHAYSILYIDINNFKTVNDTFGHVMGDQVLKEIAIILEESVRKNDRVCRFGGDEFLLLIDAREESVLKNITSIIRTKLGENKLLQSLNSQIDKNVDAAVGWHVFQKNTILEERLNNADQKMYENKVVMNGHNGNGIRHPEAVKEA